MPRIDKESGLPLIKRHRVDTKGANGTNDANGVKPAVVSNVPTKELVGYLPKIEKLDVEKIAKKEDAGIKGIKGARLVAEIDTGVKSASGIAHFPTGELAVVDDDKGVYLLKSDGKAQRLVKDLDDCEGLCIDDKGKYLWTVEEEKRRVTRYDIKRDGDGNITLDHASRVDHRLPKLKDVENKGWEGITYLPKEIAGTKADQLVCVHEGDPRRIGFYSLPDLDDGIDLRLPKRAKELLPDLADVAVDPKTGHLLVVSDEAHTVVELAIKRDNQKAGNGLLPRVELAVVSSFEIPIKRSAKTEGLCFDGTGRLWVTCDGTGDALVLELDR